MRTIEGIEYGNAAQNQRLNFAHANGFHPDTYKYFIGRLTDTYAVSAPVLMPYDANIRHTSLTSWDQIADEIIAHIHTTHNHGCIGIGHSLGAVSSLIASQKSPEIFSALVLLEPVFLPRFLYTFLRCIPTMAMKKKIVPVAKIASRRRDTWDSMEEAHSYLRKKKVFAQITGDNFDNFIATTLVPTPEGKVTLRYTKDWEAQVYATATNPWPHLERIRIPTFILRGATTDVILPSVWKKMKATNPNVECIEIDTTGHLLPLEAPERIAEIVLKCIEKLY